MGKTMSRTIQHDHGIEEREHHYASGLVEISYYVPPVLKGAMPILVAVVSRQGQNLAWNAYLTTETGQIHRRSMTKRHMVQQAWDHAQQVAASHRERFGGTF